MLKIRNGICLWLMILQLQHTAFAKEHHNERLHVRPLQDGRLYTHFSFETFLEGAAPRHPDTSSTEDEPQHYTVFPLALGQIIREYAVTEMHLSINAGKWNYGVWGYPDDPSVGSGAELWTWMADSGDGSFDDRWQGLRNALAGLFCASLGGLDKRRTTSPFHSFRPAGDLPSDLPHRLIYASQPSENVCTENLTPFLKLLPCKSRSGIASLLNPHRLFDADWHGLSVHVVWRENAGVDVRLGVQAVFNPVRLIGNNKRDWSFWDIFERMVDKACPVAETSVISVEIPKMLAYSLTPEPTRAEGGLALYDVADAKFPLNIAMSFVKEAEFAHPLEHAFLSPLSVARIQTGASQTSGRLQVTFTNAFNTTQRVVYLETPPWFIKFYLSTLTLTLGTDPQHRTDILESLTYIPSKENNPTLFEPILIVPAQSTVHLELAFEKSFLRYTEHPPDAQRGWDLPPAVLVPLNGNGAADRIYTTTLLVDLATPDFSMPYNVIILTCTLVAILFGSIFNILTRTFVAVKVD